MVRLARKPSPRAQSRPQKSRLSTLDLPTIFANRYIASKRSPRIPTDSYNRATPKHNNFTRYFETRTKLQPIPEETREEHSDPYRDAHDAFDDELSGDEDIEMFEWDETTLVAAFMDGECVVLPVLCAYMQCFLLFTPFRSSDSENQKVIAKVNALQDPISALSKETKIDIVTTLVPAAKRLQDAHAILESKIDPAFGEGFLGFDDSCQKVERAAREEKTTLTPILEDIQVRFNLNSGVIAAC
jgi:hypothetical protein